MQQTLGRGVLYLAGLALIGILLSLKVLLIKILLQTVTVIPCQMGRASLMLPPNLLTSLTNLRLTATSVDMWYVKEWPIFEEV
jgi:hypothetical protein